MDETRESHWQDVYETRAEDGVSWFQKQPEPSLELVALTGARPDEPLIDIGGGASRLVDALLKRGHTDVTVLDLSAAALETARARLGDKAGGVTWIAADATEWTPDRRYAVWHDRAAFHFLTDPADRARYVERLKAALRPGGHAIIGTFAPDGPEKCSGLPVMRHDAESLAAEVGDGFELVDTRHHVHRTPWGSEQRFQFSTFRRQS